MAVRFLHVADVDLGVRPSFMGEAAETRGQEILETFREAVSFALDPANRIDGLLIAGNLFDRHRPPADVWAFVRGLFGRLAAAQKTVVLVPGARDSNSYKDSVYRTEKFPGADIIMTPRPGPPLQRTVAGQQVFFYGMAPQAGGANPMFPGFERVDQEGLHIGLVNGALRGHAEWDVRPRDLVLEPSVLSASGLDYIALGGFHDFSPLHLEGTTAAYAGTLEGRSFLPGDLGRKSLLVVEIEAGQVLFERHAISRRVLEDWTLDLHAEEITDPKALAAAILARAGADVIARVTLTGSLEFLCAIEEVAAALENRFCWLEVRDRTDLLASGLLLRIRNEGTIRGYFTRRILDRIEDLQNRLRREPDNPGVLARLAVSRLALKLGLEQFLEDEPVSAIPVREPAAQEDARLAQAAASHGDRGQATQVVRARSAGEPQVSSRTTPEPGHALAAQLAREEAS